MHVSRSLPVDPQEPARTLLVAPDGPVEERLARVPSVVLSTVPDADAADDRLDDVECVVAGWDLPGGDAADLLVAIREADHRLPFLLYEVSQPVEFVESLVADPFADYLPRDADPDGRLLEGRVRTLASYRRSLAELDFKEQLLNRTPIGVTVTDTTLGGDPIVYANEGFERVTGYDRETVLGRNWEFLDDHGADRDVVDEVRAAVADGVSASVDMVEFRDETPYWNRFDIEPHDDYVLGFHRDVTEHKRTELRLAEQRERLDAVADLLADGAGAVLEAAVERAREAGEEDLAATLEGVGAVVDDVRRLVRHDEATDRRVVELSAAVRDAWAAVPTRGATLAVDGDRRLEADREMLDDALRELLANAVVHGSASGPDAVSSGEGMDGRSGGDTERPVSVTVGATDDGFYVADDGPGVPERRREEVFELGYSGTESGTGLGLGIVRKVVDAHGWSLSVTDSKEGGARFEVGNVDPVG